MPFVNMKKASSQAGGGKSFAVRVTTMDAELEFSYIEVCSLKTTQPLYYMLLTNPELLNFPTINGNFYKHLYLQFCFIHIYLLIIILNFCYSSKKQLVKTYLN